VADIPANDFEAIPEGYKRVTTLQGMSFNVPEEYDAHNNDSGNLYSEPLESLDQDGSSALYYQTYFSEGENLGEVLSNIWSYNGQGQEYSIYTDVSITGANGQPVDSECLLQDWLDGTYAVTCYVTGPNGTHRVKVHQSGTSTFNDVLAAAKALNITVQ
jgi:hypothetical protein